MNYEQKVIKEKGLENKKYNFLLTPDEITARMPLKYRTFREKLKYFIDKAKTYHHDIKVMLLFLIESYLTHRDTDEAYRHLVLEFDGELNSWDLLEFMGDYVNQLPVLFEELSPDEALEAAQMRVDIKYKHILIQEEDSNEN